MPCCSCCGFDDHGDECERRAANGRNGTRCKRPGCRYLAHLKQGHDYCCRHCLGAHQAELELNGGVELGGDDDYPVLAGTWRGVDHCGAGLRNGGGVEVDAARRSRAAGDARGGGGDAPRPTMATRPCARSAARARDARARSSTRRRSTCCSGPATREYRDPFKHEKTCAACGKPGA